MSPSVGDFVAQSLLVIFVQLRYVFKVPRALCHQSPLFQEREDVGEVIFLRIVLDVPHKLVLWNTNQGVLDPVIWRSELKPYEGPR